MSDKDPIIQAIRATYRDWSAIHQFETNVRIQAVSLISQGWFWARQTQDTMNERNAAFGEALRIYHRRTCKNHGKHKE